jgi:DNA-directed RNA polymerase specialized sigma24 family protein
MTTPTSTRQLASVSLVETVEMIAAATVGQLPLVVRDGHVLGWACDEIHRKIHSHPTPCRSALITAVTEALSRKLLFHLNEIVSRLIRGAPARIRREQADLVADAFVELWSFHPPGNPPPRMSVWFVLEFFARRQVNALLRRRPPRQLRTNPAAPLGGADLDFRDWIDSLRLDPLDRAVLLDMVDANSLQETARAQNVTLGRVNRRRWRLRTRLRRQLGVREAATLVG